MSTNKFKNILLTCANCHITFFRASWEVEFSSHYCSRKCYFNSRVTTLKSAFKVFLAKVNKTDTCWLWKGAINPVNKYGAFGFNYKVITAHGMSWTFHNGPVPDGKLVLHKCDVKLCVNPDHLFLGNHKDNMMDMVTKNRQPKGEQKPLSKLKEFQVKEIRRLLLNKVPTKYISDKFGVCRQVVNAIGRNAIWKHVL